MGSSLIFRSAEAKGHLADGSLFRIDVPGTYIIHYMLLRSNMLYLSRNKYAC